MYSKVKVGHLLDWNGTMALENFRLEVPQCDHLRLDPRIIFPPWHRGTGTLAFGPTWQCWQWRAPFPAECRAI